MQMELPKLWVGGWRVLWAAIIFHFSPENKLEAKSRTPARAAKTARTSLFYLLFTVEDGLEHSRGKS